MIYTVKIPEAYARIKWCKETFGPSMQGLPKSERTWNKMRWWRNKGSLCFRNEQDYIWFMLRWA